MNLGSIAKFVLWPNLLKPPKPISMLTVAQEPVLVVGGGLVTDVAG
jgi:hypothetical protein